MQGKKIILGVTGGIAAYKTAYLVRLLIKQGAEVQVLMTEFAEKFITPLTLATLSKRPVLKLFYNPENGDWNSHVDLGLWADAMIIAPATANTLSKAANGIADNLLITTYLSARCPVFWAPAMDYDMMLHPAVKANINKLQAYGNHIIEAEVGELASGLTGKGRMAEPEHIIASLQHFWSKEQTLKGCSVLVTAGPTREAIDPVRFIGNHSSGKMGYALAEVCAERGAEVFLVSGPSSLQVQHPSIKKTTVESAEEMFEVAKKYYPQANSAIFAAAVADYTPKTKSCQKLKKSSENLQLELKKTKDIALELGKMKTGHQIHIGFALETENEEENAHKKLIKKNLDAIVLNSLQDEGAGFGYDTNKIKIIDKDNNIQEFELKSKREAAEDIVDHLIKKLGTNSSKT